MPNSIFNSLYPFATAASAVEWFFIAVLSAAVKKEIHLCELCGSNEQSEWAVNEQPRRKQRGIHKGLNPFYRRKRRGIRPSASQ